MKALADLVFESLTQSRLIAASANFYVSASEMRVIPCSGQATKSKPTSDSAAGVPWADK